MSEHAKDSSYYDPTGVFKTMRETGMDAWSKLMVDMVNTDGYAKAQAEMLNAWLSSSMPLRKAIESAMAQSLASLCLPSRDDVTRLAERLTNIEMKLDDLDARIDALCAAAATETTTTSRKRKGGEEGDQ